MPELIGEWLTGAITPVVPFRPGNPSEKARWLCTESTELPSSAALRAANSPASSVNATNSVVQTGVKSAGWLNRISHRPA